MDRNTVKTKLLETVRKYRYAAIIVLIGIVLMVIPANTQNTDSTQPASEAQQDVTTLEERLSQLLSSVYGAGKVEIILTLSSGEETLYQTNDDTHAQGEDLTSKSNTVTVTDAQRNESGLIRQINPPIYRGAVIVCQGADNPAVRLALVEAVGKATGLGADKISVLKMK